VGTEQPGLISLLQLSPNPTPGRSVLTVDLVKPAALEVVVINPLGQVVMSKRNILPGMHHSVTIDLEHFPVGYYRIGVVPQYGPKKWLWLARISR
jgi:hypothetical protein